MITNRPLMDEKSPIFT